MLTEKPKAQPAATTPRAGAHGAAELDRRPRRVLRGRLRRAARRQGQHHDPRVHVRHRRVRGHPGLLERGAGRPVRAEAARAHGAHPAQRRDAADDATCRRSTSSSGSWSRRSAATGSARTRTSGRASTSPASRSACGCTTCPTSCVVLALPFGNYIDTESGVRVMTSTWRRNADDALPARGKIVGGYVNMAFQKSEAELNGFDEALVLTADGHASEASAANLFVVRDGVLLTPPVTDDILEGVTRKADPGARRGAGHPDRDRARSTAPRSTSPTRCSCAAPASSSRRSSSSTTARSRAAPSARSRSSSTRPTTPRFGGEIRASPTG